MIILKNYKNPKKDGICFEKMVELSKKEGYRVMSRKSRKRTSVPEGEKGRRKKKKKYIAILCTEIFVLLLLVLGIGGYFLISRMYGWSNFISDDEVRKQFENRDEVDYNETLNPDEAQGEMLSPEEYDELIKKHQEFANAEPITTDGDVYNILLIGVDVRASDGKWAGNSDSMMLLSINYKKEQISLVSLMRDTYVDIPGIGMRKLNAAHANGAGPLLIETVTKNYKVQVDRYATVDFNNMIDIIDLIGKIEITLSDAEARSANDSVIEMCEERKISADKHLFKKGGTYKCNGIQAVAYARIRKVGHADYQRTERQREVMTKLMEKAKAMSLTELYSLAEKVLPMVTHNIPEKEIWGILPKAPSILQYTFVKDRIPYDGMYKVIYVKGQDMLVPDWQKTIAKLKETLY